MHVDKATTGERMTFSSSWGTIMTLIGVSVGLGNIWRFPYMMGHFGGGAFLLIFLAATLLLALPALMVEWALGRHTKAGPLEAYSRVGIPFGRLLGPVLLLAIVGGLSYYPVVIGWTLYFSLAYALPEVFSNPLSSWDLLSHSWSTQWICAVVSAGLGAICLLFGLNRGIEWVSKVFTILFFFLFIALTWRVLTLPGANEGLRIAFVPVWDKMTPGTVMAAVGQALYSVGVGGTIMVIYGAYLRSEESIPRAAGWAVSVHVISALIATALIIPTVTAFGVVLTSGPSLLFESMPKAFAVMPFSRIMGGTFFFAIFIIAMLALINAMEVLRDAMAAYVRGAVPLMFGIIVLITIPATFSLDFLFKSDLVWGSTMQPIGAVFPILGMAWFAGRAQLIEELERNSNFRVSPILFYWIKYVIPLTIVGTLAYGWLA